MRFGLLIPAAGQGVRAGGDRPKQFQTLAGQSVLERALACFRGVPDVAAAVVAVPAGAVGETTALLQGQDWGFPVTVIAGGAERQQTVRLMLAALPPCERVIVHDAARPLLERAALERALAAAREHQAVCMAVPVRDTIKRVAPAPHAAVDGGALAAATLDRSELWAAQTPQIFEPGLLERAHRAAEAEGRTATDDAALVEALGEPVLLVPGSDRNFKLTTPDDFALARALLGGGSVRTGIGYDVHRFAAGRPCIIGGVEVPHTHGLDGHSDADVLTHAIIDALLGAAGLGDIGRHFPDTDEQWRGADSIALLSIVRERVAAAGWRIVNIDATVVGERPKLAPHADAIVARLAETLALTPGQVNVKASTNERLGFLGREEGLVAYAVATLTAG